MARIHGKRGSVLMDPTGGVTVVAVANLNEWTLDMKKDRVDVTAMGDTNKQSVLGLADFSGTLAGFWDATAVTLMDAIMADIAVKLHLVPDTAAATFLWKGLAYLDGNINVSATGAVTIGASFVAAGPWVMEP